MRASFLVALGAVGTMVAAAVLVVAGPASAATTWNVYCPGGDLQYTIDNLANPGDTIVVYGTCYGNFVIDSLGFAPTPLTLQGGSAGATLNGRGNDSALKIFYDTVTIRNLTITNGAASQGGGLELGTATLSMSNSTVKGNRADYGGGIFAQFSTLDLTGVTVTRNAAAFGGGGLDLVDSDLSAIASTISLNRTTQFETRGGGGGIRMDDANVLLTSTKVTTNTSARFGGGIADYGLCPKPNTPPAIPTERVRCVEDVAGRASGGSVVERSSIDNLPSGLTLVNSSVDHNIAADDGGGIYNDSLWGDSPVTLQASTVSFNNSQSGDGGGIANYGECDNTASLLATGSTFQGNQARHGDGGAVYNSTGNVIQLCITVEAGTGSGAALFASAALVTIAQTGIATGPNVVNANQAAFGGGFANEQDANGVASLTLQPGATVRGNKASVTGGGVWNNCGSFSSLGQIFLNAPNNIVSTCIRTD